MRLRSRKIFVSYRRSDTPEIAQRLYERLSQQFGAVNVFYDQADIEYGQLWREEVTRQIRSADIVIALVGPKWLETLRARSRSDDVLRFELATALTQQKEVIPVLVGATPMPHSGQLPEEVRRLTEFQALPLSDDMDLAVLELLGRVKPGLGLAVRWSVANVGGWLVGVLVLVFALMLLGIVRGNPQAAAASASKIVGCTLAGALAGACVAVPQWLVLRAWFERARFLIPVYVALSAIGVSLAAASVMLEREQAVGAAALIIVLVPMGFAGTLWWIVSREMIYAGWWSTAHLLAPVAGLLITGIKHPGGGQAQEGVTPAGLTANPALALVDLFVPMLLLSLASGMLLVWLMRISEIKRR
jgi:hypothetical protein